MMASRGTDGEPDHWERTRKTAVLVDQLHAASGIADDWNN
jgi:hypothetical protein